MDRDEERAGQRHSGKEEDLHREGRQGDLRDEDELRVQRSEEGLRTDTRASAKPVK